MKSNLPFPASLALAIAMVSGCKPPLPAPDHAAESNATAELPPTGTRTASPAGIADGGQTNAPGATNTSGTNPAVETN